MWKSKTNLSYHEDPKLFTQVGLLFVLLLQLCHDCRISKSRRIAQRAPVSDVTQEPARIILPLRVLGSSAAKRISSGRAIDPIFFVTWPLRSSTRALESSAPALNATKTQIAPTHQETVS